MQKIFDNLLIIGVGLIGGSLAKGLKQKGLVSEVAGFGRNKASLQVGVESGVLDTIVDDLAIAVRKADMIVIAVPTLAVKEYFTVIEANRKKTAVVTDVASVKGDIAQEIITRFGEIPPWFILGHPIAGSEKSGIHAANPTLFENHKVILTPVDSSLESAVLLTTTMWQSLGAEVVDMSIDQHDIVLAATSHLPHLLAFALVDCLQDMDANVDVFRFAAGGFRDFTRIAGSDPVMWHDIMLANKSSIKSMISAFKLTLDTLEESIDNNNSEFILSSFKRAKKARDHFQTLIEVG